MPDNYVYELILSDEQHTNLLTYILQALRRYTEYAEAEGANNDFWKARIAAAERLLDVVRHAMPINLNLMEQEFTNHAPG